MAERTLRSTLAAIRALLRDRSRFRGQPSHLESKLEDALAGASVGGSPLRLIAEWGLAADSRLRDDDVRALDYLRETIDLVAGAVGVRCDPLLLLMDSHARVNGAAPEQYAGYARDVAAAASQRTFATRHLSAVLAEYAGWTLDRLLAESECFEPEWAELSAYTREEMVRRAAAHSIHGTPEDAARLYFCVSRLEGLMLAAHLAGSVFVTYQTPNFAFLLPAIPTIHTFVEAGRLAHRPWFVCSRTDTGK